MKYEYGEFKKAIKELLQKRLGDGVSVEYVEDLKNNQTVKEGIQITECGSEESLIFYPEELCEQFQEENGIENCVENLLMIFYKEKDLTLDINLTRWESVKSKVRLFLIQKAWNEEHLRKRCYIEYLDLAVVFEVILDVGRGDARSIAVTQAMLGKWGIGAEEVYHVALENLKSENVILMDSDNICGKEPYLEMESLYIFKNRRCRHGASVMLKKDIIKSFAEEKGADLYILPCSIHDLLLVKENGSHTARELKRVVCDINRDGKSVNPEDRLSDSVYLYQRETDEIQIVA